MIAAVLIGDDVLPVQRTKTEVLVQLGSEQMNIACLLKQTCRHLGAVVFGGYIAHTVIEIVLYLIDGYAQFGVRLVVTEDAFQM